MLLHCHGAARLQPASPPTAIEFFPLVAKKHRHLEPPRHANLELAFVFYHR